MYQRTRVAALCAGAVLAMGVAGCADTTTTGPIAGPDDAAAAPTSSGDESASPASTSAAAQTEYGVPTTAAPEPDPTGVATDSPVATEADGDVSVLITYADWDASSATVQAGATVSGVIEDGGTCTLELSSGASTVSASVTAVADAASTSCGRLEVPRAQLSPGTWQAVVSYRSASATGSSDPTEVVVP
jgi:hypothetical protein